MTSSSSNVARNLGPPVAVVALAALISPAWAESDVEVPEPLFTEQAAVEAEAELEFGFESKATEDEYEVELGLSQVFFDRLQVGASIPIGIRDPDVGSTQGNVGDVEFSTKYQFLDVSKDAINLSLAGSVATPTGDRDKEIGGTGNWGVFALAGTNIDTGEGLADLGVHLRFGYEQAIRLSNEEKEAAETLGVGGVRQKELVWGGAINTSFFDGRIIPTFEVLGRTILDAVDPDKEGTILELGGGFWLRPFAEGSDLGPLSLGVAAKGPVTNRRESDFSALVVVKYEFE